ncbi:MAG TPA: hypothetical protein PKL73_23755, partial [Polyangiaceae bacterium]|nr:hypothetical protein [Polyangiaceae bacterium]HNZ23868.1 hypothetical protein [Polyangiaceae bacterium]HOD22339.1 hypothetical protein [Polyangiaceae bacterium]HOE50240.1 hypothetical protein [Polyangiaceae bacterium]HOH01636.1 hypothetical protein [Polyangiaceae bacterium]
SYAPVLMWNEERICSTSRDMSDGALLRLLEIARRELGADDACVEIGGLDPEDPRFVWVKLSAHRRVVLRFSEPPAARDKVLERLRLLVEAYSGTIVATTGTPTGPAVGLTQALLNEQLAMLAERLEAVNVSVFDDVSPVVWGSSDPFQRGERGMDDALRIEKVWEACSRVGVDLLALLVKERAEVEQTLVDSRLPKSLSHATMREWTRLRAERPTLGVEEWRALLLSVRAWARIRQNSKLKLVRPRARIVVRQEGIGFLAKPFAATYWIVAVFDGDFSELHAEGMVVRAIPRIERLVMALPPLVPPPARGRVLRLRRPKG